MQAGQALENVPALKYPGMMTKKPFCTLFFSILEKKNKAEAFFMEEAEQYSLFQKSIFIIMKGYVKSKKSIFVFFSCSL